MVILRADGLFRSPSRRHYSMWPHSIRSHLAGVFLLFFALVGALGAFSIWRLSNFNLVSADIADVWLPTTRALGDLNNYTSDFRAFEGSALLIVGRDRCGGKRKANGRSSIGLIADSEREFEQIRHDAAENGLYEQLKADWNAYRSVVNEMLALARDNRPKDGGAANLRNVLARGL